MYLGSGGRRKILENGNLIIAPVSRDDDGIYTCIAENMHGTAESQGRLIVLSMYIFRLIYIFLLVNLFICTKLINI